MSKEKNENPEGQEKQQPEKPKKAAAEMDLKKLLIIVGIAAVVFGLVVIIGLKMIMPAPSEPADDKKDKSKSEKEKKEKAKEEEEEEAGEEAEHLTVHTSIPSFTVITKDFSWYIQIQLGLDVKFPNEDEMKKATGGGGHGGPAAGPISEKTMAVIKSKINGMIGSMNIEDIKKIPRDSLPHIFMKELKPILKEAKLNLKKVTLENFVPARAE